MHVIIAPNAFKGSLSASDAAESIARGLAASGFSCKISLFPIADGGDGTVSLLADALGGEKVRVPVHDPLGRSIEAAFGWLEHEGTALIGLSDASGLKLLTPDERDPLLTNTFGTGELMSAALAKGARRIWIGVGGSATVDGGAGLASALGIRFLDASGKDIPVLPQGLSSLASVSTSEADSRLGACDIKVLCDVDNPLLGVQGAARVFGPQKGANVRSIAALEQRLSLLDEAVWRTTGIRMRSLPAGGSAGGAAAGLAAFTGAILVSGIDFFLDVLGFDALLEKADLVITGEGSLDSQTLEGKAPVGVARRARARGIPVIGMAGVVTPDPRLETYFGRTIAINVPGESLEDSMRHTAAHLEAAACALGTAMAAKDPLA